MDWRLELATGLDWTGLKRTAARRGKEGRGRERARSGSRTMGRAERRRSADGGGPSGRHELRRAARETTGPRGSRERSGPSERGR